MGSPLAASSGPATQRVTGTSSPGVTLKLVRNADSALRRAVVYTEGGEAATHRRTCYSGFLTGRMI